MRPFQTQHGRDLAWLLTSPPLLFHRTVVDARWGEMQLARNQGLAARLDQPGSALAKAVRRMSSNRLGEYFETLLQTWIEEVPEAHLLGSNVQVHGGGGTVGEFDLVFKRDRSAHHWELAVKFYLGYPGRDGPIWYGPNPVDVLRDKWRHMRKHQLRLAEHPAAEPTLRRLGVGRRLQTAAYIRGYLYEALDPAFATHHHPHANRDGLRGWWVHRSGLDAHRPEGADEMRWLRLSKLQWLSEARPDPDTRVDDDLGALVHRLGPTKPHHVVGLIERDGQWVEVSRGFVVPDGWPD